MNRFIDHAIKNQNGFTLVEVLIGITILGFILLLTFSSLHSAGKNWAVNENKTNQIDEMRLASRFMRQYIQQTVPLVWMRSNGRQIAFQGKPDEIDFVSPLPAHRGGGGLYLLAIKTIQQTDGIHLALQYQLATPQHQSFDFSADGSQETAVLAEDMDELSITYFGKLAHESEARWYTEWRSADVLPHIVRIRIASSTNHTQWPDMLITIPAQAQDGRPEQLQYAVSTRNAL